MLRRGTLDFVETRQTLRGKAETAGTALWLIFSAESVAMLSVTAGQAVNFVPVSFPTFSPAVFQPGNLQTHIFSTQVKLLWFK